MDNKVTAISVTRILSLLVILTLFKALSPVPALAADLPLAAGSPLAGFAFDDRPLLLPVQRNFQMAMLTAGSELGRTCGKMEAYGWRMSAAEQQRVNQIFTNTVDRLRGLGYSIEAQAPTSVSKDITMFTADRQNKHFLFMWSAGEIGLVMTLCETAAPIAAHAIPPAFATQTYDSQQDNIVKSTIASPVRDGAQALPPGKFSPIGNWSGGYTCGQGYTGATLSVTHLTKNNNFDGTFRFYPTTRNRAVPNGRFEVTGQYDPGSQRMLINPGRWIQHPKGYFSTVMVGGFDAAARTFSAYFQGVTGCTSFEAKYISGGPVEHKEKKKAVTKKTARKTTAPKKAAPVKAETAPISTLIPATTTAPAPTTAPPVSPAVPEQPAMEPPASIILPPVNAPEPAPAPKAPAAAPSAPAPTTAPAPVGTSAPGKSGSIEPLVHKILVASGEWFTPQVPSAPQPQTYNSNPQPATPPSIFNSTPPQVVPAQNAPTPNYVSPADRVNMQPATAPMPQRVPDPAITDGRAPTVPGPNMIYPDPEKAQPPQKVPDPGGPPKP